MSRVVKILLFVFGGLVALIIAAAIALPLFFDPNDYKDELAAAVQDKTGRELTIAGEIDLSVFPWLGAEVGESRLANAEGFGDKPFAEIAKAQIRVKLLPLFSKRIEIGTVSLDGLRLRLARNDNGRTNWDDIVEKLAEDTPAEEDPAQQPDAGDSGDFQMPELEIEAISISDAAISWNDATTGERYDLTEFKLSTGRLVPGQPFRMDAGFNLDAPQQGVSAKTSFVAELQADLASQFYRMGDFSLNVLAKGQAVPNGEQQLDVKGNAEVDMQAGRMKVTDLLVQTAGLSVTGAVDGNGLSDKPAFNGRLTVKEFNPRSVMQRLGIAPPATQDSSAFTKAGLDAQFDATTTRAALKQVLIRLDDSTLKGEASVRNFEKPNVGFKLAMNSINVDRYMPPESQAPAAGQQAPQSKEEAQTGEIELEPLRDLTLDGRVTIEKLLVSKLNISDAELAVTANDGVFRVEPLGANLYSGRLRMQGQVDGSGERNGYSIKGNLTGLKFGPLLQDLIGQQKVDGLANLQVDLKTSGNTVEAIKRSLDGTLSFEFRDGLFNGFNLANLIQTARAKFLNQPVEQSAADTQTKFSRFAASFSASNGVFAGKSFNLNAAGLNADGGGSYDLAANQLDYSIATTISENISNDNLRKLAGLTVPIKLSGELFSPSFNVDIKSAMQGLAAQKLEAEKAELQQKLQEKLGEERKELQEKLGGKQGELNEKVQQKLQKGLSDLFGGSKKKGENPPPAEPSEPAEPAAP